MGPSLAEELSPLILHQIKDAYFQGKLTRTIDVGSDMSRNKLNEADVEMFFNNIDCIYKTKKAHSPLRTHEKNTHYYMRGKSIDDRDIFCKISSTYHPKTGEFVCWTLTSFCEWKYKK
jgi:hypothetical protein